MTDLFIFVGEQSADLYGSQLLEALKRMAPQLKTYGIGGPRMRSLGFDCLLPMENFQIMRLADCVLHRRRLNSHFEKTIASILTKNPRMVLLIDYPGVIPLLAKKLRQRGYLGKILQYICPSLLFSGKKSKRAMEETLNALLTIFPFEVPLFSDCRLPATFVGHPALERLSCHAYSSTFHNAYGIDPDAPLIAIFPGSRTKVLKGNFPPQFLAALKLQKEIPFSSIAISVANEESMRFLEPLVKGYQKVVLIPETHTYDLMRHCSMAIATSGTTALELALHEKPAVVTYAASLLDAWVGKYYSKWPFPHYCLVNVLAREEVFKELFYKDCTEEKIYRQARDLCFSLERREECIARCAKIKSTLSLEPVEGEQAVHSSERVAKFLVDIE